MLSKRKTLPVILIILITRRSQLKCIKKTKTSGVNAEKCIHLHNFYFYRYIAINKNNLLQNRKKYKTLFSTHTTSIIDYNNIIRIQYYSFFVKFFNRSKYMSDVLKTIVSRETNDGTLLHATIVL